MQYPQNFEVFITCKGGHLKIKNQRNAEFNQIIGRNYRFP